MVTYCYSEELAEIGRRLVAQHHPDLVNFGAVEIRYIFRSEASKSNGKVVWGKARKVGGLGAFLAMDTDDAPTGEPPDDPAEAFFVIEIAHDVWLLLSPKQKVALVDHELCHLSVALDEAGAVRLSIRPHDLEEFEAILSRHSLWRPDLESFAVVAAKQLSLLQDGEVPWPERSEPLTVPPSWSA